MGFRVSEFENRELSRELQRLKGLVRVLAVAISEASKTTSHEEYKTIEQVATLVRKTIKEEVFSIPKKPISAWVIISVLKNFDYMIWDSYVRYDDAKKSIYLHENSILVPASILHNLREELEDLRRE